MEEITTNEYPVLPFRGRVLFPNNSISFDVGRTQSLLAIQRATEVAQTMQDKDMRLFLCTQKVTEKEEVGESDLYEVGTVIKVKQVTKLPGNTYRVQVEGLYRARARRFRLDGCMMAVCDPLPPVFGKETLQEAYYRTVRDRLYQLFAAENSFPKDLSKKVDLCTEPDVLVNIVAQVLKISIANKQQLLECEYVTDRLRMLDKYLLDEMEIQQLERKISATVRQNIEKNQKEYYLREQIKAIHTELGDDEEEKDELKRAIEGAKMPKEVEEKALKELNRMSKMPTSSPEYNVVRTYIDILTELTWSHETTDTENLADAVAILNADHYGLEKVKERITEYLAVLKLTKGMNAPILCLVGPPGVGKTSIAQSVAKALGREFVRMSLGGVKDESEIRGHRRTYIGSMPGRIITGIKTVKSINPVFLLDEIDKLSSDMRGDPASALLEVLDPAQNATFRDRYLEVPYDLSKVLFITTANSYDTIPLPLLDRMEVISLDGYTVEEKLEIAKRYLVPKKRKANGVDQQTFAITDEAILKVIESYTREAGVRNLERHIDTLCRKVAVKVANGEPISDITEVEVEQMLGNHRIEKDVLPKEPEVGSATGLAWTAVGGTTLTIDVTTFAGKGEILLTGKLGDVMKESARTAISYIRSHAEQYGIEYSLFEKTDIHIHIPEGATPKDGPSAGITMATAILSAFTKKPVKNTIAMTGEITLRGKVLPIGGLKEKSLAAYRLGVTEVIIPQGNCKDLEEIPQAVKDGVKFIPVSDVKTVFENAIIGL